MNIKSLFFQQPFLFFFYLIIFPAYAQNSASNFLLGSWEVQGWEFEEENLLPRSVGQDIAGYILTFTEDAMIIPGLETPIPVYYDIDGKNITVSPREGDVPEERFLHFFLLHEDGRVIIGDFRGWTLEEAIILHRVGGNKP